MKIEFKDSISSLRSTLIRDGWAMTSIKDYGLIYSEVNQDILEKYKNAKLVKSFDYKSGSIEKSIVKQAYGDANGLGNPYPQFLNTLYIGGDVVSSLQELADSIVNLRDDILELSPDEMSAQYGSFFNAKRIHFYPSGAGFMACHRDTYFPSALGEKGLKFLQVCLLLSRKGVDFHSGGFYLIDRSGVRIYPEEFSAPGTILLFDGSISHGVETIDSSEVYDQDSLKGRYALFVNLYKKL